MSTERRLLSATRFAVLSVGDRQWVAESPVDVAEVESGQVLGRLVQAAPRRRYVPRPHLDVEVAFTSEDGPPMDMILERGELRWPMCHEADLASTDWDGQDETELAALEAEEGARVAAIVNVLSDRLPSPARVFEVGVSHGLLLRRLALAIDDIELAGCDPSPTMLRHAQNRSTPGWLVQADHRLLRHLHTRCHAVVSRALSAHVMTREEALDALQGMASILLPNGVLVLASRHAPLIWAGDLRAVGLEVLGTTRRYPGGRLAPFLIATRPP